jgi:putative flavoprotein involved in K+ transport
MVLHGRLTDVDGSGLAFADDLEHNLDNADAVSESIKDSIDRWIERTGTSAPTEARYIPVWRPENPATTLDLAAAGISTVVWSTGFGRDDRWIEVPVFDGRGLPTHDRGVTCIPGLYFLGLPWQYTWGSGRFSGVAADAEHLARHILRHETEASIDVAWIAGTRYNTWPSDDEWTAPRTVA